MSTKTPRKAHKGSEPCENHVRKRGQQGADTLDVDALKINLEHLVGSLSSGGKVQAYEQIAADLSRLAGRVNGDSWSWRYVAKVNSRSMEPGKKFLRALHLLLEDFQPRSKQWFYFAHYHSVAAVYDRSLKREIITEHMRGLGYKPVSFTRHNELKRRAVRGRK